ncbi:uncharacterized protein ACOB8E_002640 isoform 1-T1 [Sarcophilus harrisii]
MYSVHLALLPSRASVHIADFLGGCWFARGQGFTGKLSQFPDVRLSSSAATAAAAAVTSLPSQSSKADLSCYGENQEIMHHMHQKKPEFKSSLRDKFCCVILGGALSRHSISTARSENIFSETIIWRVFPNVSYFLEEETSKRKSLCSSAGFKPKCEQMKLVSSSILSPFLRPVCSTFQFYLTWLTTNDPVEVRNRMLRCRPYVLRSTFGIPKCN